VPGSMRPHAVRSILLLDEWTAFRIGGVTEY
jgi:hypothetical protein